MVRHVEARHRSRDERFDAYVERCLYDRDRGFYRGGGGSAGGRSGDFITSPEVGPLFADVLGLALDQWWEEQGRPDPFRVFDAGTGPGTLCDQLTRLGGASSEARVVVGFDQADSLPVELSGSIVIANEVLDNIAFRVLERRQDGWSELHVLTDDSGRAVEDLRPCDPSVDDDLAHLGALAPLDTVAVGSRVPVVSGARRWLRELLDRAPARLLAFDYGAPSTLDLVKRGGWLRTYRGHQRGVDPLVEPGLWDITTDIGFDQLPPPAKLETQADFLRRWGIEQLVVDGRDHWHAHAARPDLQAMRMRSRVREAEALLDPAGLGHWFVATWYG